jgi:ubiquinone/menaquinone biosynthesis C-methylase UbiE
MKNETYPDSLLEDYDLLMGAYPQHFKLREEVAIIVDNHFGKSKGVILDIGCGAGETTEYILKKNSSIKIIAVDNDKRIINRLKERLKEYVSNNRLTPICADIFDYIKEIDSSFFDGITSSWTLHNFSKEKRNVLLNEIFRILKSKGIFVNMDKYVSDDPKKEQESFDEVIVQLKLIPKKELSDKSIKHEEEDRHPNIIMKESESVSEMKSIGFKKINFHTRVGREIIMSCYK